MKVLILYITKYMLPFMITIALFSCSSRPKMISDSDLKKIISESVMAESFLAYIPNKTLNKDSMSFYKPILDKHGYTIEDMRYTIGKHAMRKSAVLTVIMDDIIKDYDSQLSRYREISNIKEKWIKSATDFSADTIYKNDTTLRITSHKNLKNRISIRIPAFREGDYEIMYKYKLDTADKNNTHTFNYAVDYSKVKMKKSRTKLSGTSWLSKSVNEQELKNKINISYSDSMYIDYTLIKYNPDDSKRKPPILAIDSIRVVYYPPLEQALDRYYKYKAKINLDYEKDSSILHVSQARPEEERDNSIQR